MINPCRAMAIMYIISKMSNKILCKLTLIITAILIASVAAQPAVRISTFDDLRRIGRDPSFPVDGNYELVSDINASDSRVRPFEPIGTFEEPFVGKFYGRGGETFVVKNLYINRPKSGHTGLFGVVGYGGLVANVGVVVDTVIGHFAVGTLAGTNNGWITGCYGTGAVFAGRAQSNAGGLVGVNGGMIFKSYSMADVDGRENAGGLVGFMVADGAGTGEISQSFAGGAVSGSNNVGGLVGHIFGGAVSESFAFGRVSGKGGRGAIGGLIGRDFAASAAWNERGITQGDSAYVRAAEIRGSYWDIGASGRSSSAGGAGKTSAEMFLSSTYAGWDFGGVWSIVDGVHPPQLVDIPLYTHALSYSVDSEERGRLRVLDMGAGGVIVDLYAYERKLMYGTAAFSVEALPWDGYRFVRWSDGVVHPVREDTAFLDMSLTAVFALDGGELAPARIFSYTAGIGGSIRVSGVSGLADYSGELAVAGGARGPAVAAVPDEGYRFYIWSDGVSAIVRTDDAAGDLAVTAFFVEVNREPIRLFNYDDLLVIGRSGRYPLDGIYELARDIDMSVSSGFSPIGARTAPFRGVFRGNGYRIHGFNMNRPEWDDVGLFGYIDGARISGVRLEAEIVAGRGSVGLLVGESVNSVIDSCETEGVVRGKSYTGGLVGNARVTLITRSRSSAIVDGGELNAGGLVGAAAGVFMAQNRFTGSVSVDRYAGGLAGRYDGGAAQHSYNAGSVTGRVVAGGLVGEVSGGAALIQSYSRGNVEGTGLNAGGLAGTLGAGGGRVAACFWDIESSGRKASALGNGKTSSEMTFAGTYAGWDFENVWSINSGRGYPWLREFPPADDFGMINGPRQGRASVADGPRVRVAGRTMHVSAQPGSVIRIRIIDMRGRVVAGYDVAGAAKLSLRRIPAGKYVVEVGERGKRSKKVSTAVLR